MSSSLVGGSGTLQKELKDPIVLSDDGDVPIQEMWDCEIEDERLMKTISDSVKKCDGGASTSSIGFYMVIIQYTTQLCGLL